MEAGPFETFYGSALQGTWLLLVVPALYLAWRATRPRLEAHPSWRADPSAARFVAFYGLVFAVETMLDPLANGPLAGAVGGGGFATGASVLFVLLGDFRVYLLVFVLGGVRAAVAGSALATLAVPAAALAIARSVGGAPDQLLYASHELLFVAVTVILRRLVAARTGPRRPFLEDALDFVALYYGLWAFADLVILSGGDWGYGLRVIPNQLYYALWVPFVHWRWLVREGERAASPGADNPLAPRA